MPGRALHSTLYRPVPLLLRTLRTDAGLTTRELAERVGRPQSWVFKCENAERRVDVAEFCLWCQGCGVAPAEGLEQLLRSLRLPARQGPKQTGRKGPAR